MKEVMNEKLDNLIEELENTSLMKRFVFLKEKVESNAQILEKINKLHSLDIYSSEYSCIKKELFENQEFVEFKELENEVNYLILAINQRLNKLIENKGCYHENN